MDKAYKKSCPVIRIYNDREKNLVLMNSAKIQEVSQVLVLALLPLFVIITMTTSGSIFKISSMETF